MKRIFLLLFLFAFVHTSYGQFNASQIKKDGVTVIGNAQNKLAVDTVTTIPTKDWVLNNTSGGGGGIQPGDTAAMLAPYLKINTASGTYATISNLALKVAIADTSTMLTNYLRKGLAASTYQPLITTGTTLQYFRGDLSLATFPTAVSSFSNDAGYATASSSTAFSNKTGNISQWTNDAGYITSSGVTPAALTKVDDTNVTLTLGGTPSTALLQAASITAGWTGTLADGRIASASTWNAKESALTFSTGLTRSTNTVTVNTSQNIATLSNLTSNGFVKTSGGTGALSIDGNTYFNVSNNLSEGTAATMRTNLGLGTIATQAANSVSITGGSVTGITDLTVADGGTGASTALTARANLGTADAYNSADQTTAAGTNTTITSLTFATSASETWSFECYITGQVSGAGGAKFTVVYSNTPSISTVMTTGSNTGANTITSNSTIATTPAQTATMWAFATTDTWSNIRGVFTNGASANTVTIKVAPANGAQTVTIRSGSYITARRIN